MDTKSPQETQIIADRQTLWFYDPFVEQVTANWVKDAVNNTPFVLLTSNDKSHWAQYSVEQKSDTFVLKPKAKNSNIKQFDIRIDESGVLKGFSTIEKPLWRVKQHAEHQRQHPQRRDNPLFQHF